KRLTVKQIPCNQKHLRLLPPRCIDQPAEAVPDLLLPSLTPRKTQIRFHSQMYIRHMKKTQLHRLLFHETIFPITCCFLLITCYLLSMNEQIQNIAQKKDTLCRMMYN